MGIVFAGRAGDGVAGDVGGRVPEKNIDNSLPRSSIYRERRSNTKSETVQVCP